MNSTDHNDYIKYYYTNNIVKELIYIINYNYGGIPFDFIKSFENLAYLKIESRSKKFVSDIKLLRD